MFGDELVFGMFIEADFIQVCSYMIVVFAPNEDELRNSIRNVFWYRVESRRVCALYE